MDNCSVLSLSDNSYFLLFLGLFCGPISMINYVFAALQMSVNLGGGGSALLEYLAIYVRTNDRVF